MRTALAILAAALLCGCSHAYKAGSSNPWPYQGWPTNSASAK